MNINSDNIHIGIDFDNTMVTYDKVFHKYAAQLGLIESGVEMSKQAIRDAIRLLPNGNDRWTELQGLIYGKHMIEAEPAIGFESFVKDCRTQGIKLSVISHKTIYPAMGPKYNLHEAARGWVKNNDLYEKLALGGNEIIFKEKLQGKLAAIRERGCTHFIDDLIEVLLHEEFPPNVVKILYSKDEQSNNGLLCLGSWDEIRRYFIEQ